MAARRMELLNDEYWSRRMAAQAQTDAANGLAYVVSPITRQACASRDMLGDQKAAVLPTTLAAMPHCQHCGTLRKSTAAPGGQS